MDYDYNSPNPESLKATHLPFYGLSDSIIGHNRLLWFSHPCYKEPKNDKLRRDIVKASYELALSRGDNVYFVDGCEFFPKPYGDLFSVDNLHPNDLGNYYMAKAIWPELKKALGVD